MPEETVVLPIRLTEADYRLLNDEAERAGVDVSVLARHKLAEATPGLSGKVNARGGARKGAGRPRKLPEQLAV